MVTFAGVNKVFTVKDDKAVEVNVEPGEPRTQDNNYVEIVSGLKGERTLSFPARASSRPACP